METTRSKPTKLIIPLFFRAVSNYKLTCKSVLFNGRKRGSLRWKRDRIPIEKTISILLPSTSSRVFILDRSNDKDAITIGISRSEIFVDRRFTFLLLWIISDKGWIGHGLGVNNIEIHRGRGDSELV